MFKSLQFLTDTALHMAAINLQADEDGFVKSNPLETDISGSDTLHAHDVLPVAQLIQSEH